MQSIKIGHVDVYTVLPLGGSLLRWGFLRLKCVAKYFVLFSFSHTLSPFRPISLGSVRFGSVEKTKSVYVLFALGKYKLNGIHISYTFSLSLSLWIVLCCCDLRKMFQQHLYSFSCSDIFIVTLCNQFWYTLNGRAFLQIFRAPNRGVTQRNIHCFRLRSNVNVWQIKSLGNFRMVFEPSANECAMECMCMRVCVPSRGNRVVAQWLEIIWKAIAVSETIYPKQ